MKDSKKRASIKNITVLRCGAQVDKEGNLDCLQHGGNCCASGRCCFTQSIQGCK